ncbi:Uncharacterised protein [Enterobacter hormaechei]|uniref:hypothetical protein n=1 Tax=Enterobacter hormaechei TaxID=158836 RepID=UPI0012589914|nr:hypothetical protein [Enterobacter hormaechei]VAE40954.1 Uncharacterised protein [Enterobacter hormaechei]VAM26776.1 Uncharacterised protein [Enterobacter hormaechei]
MSDGLDKYLEGIITATKVTAGFLGGSTYPDGTPVVVAATCAEYGDPANNQEPRPYFRNAIADKKEEWAKTIERGLAAGHDSRTVLEVVGAQIKGDIQESIATLMEPPLRPATLERRRNRKVMPNQSDKPLVDTRVMIGDVNYEVT